MLWCRAAETRRIRVAVLVALLRYTTAAVAEGFGMTYSFKGRGILWEEGRGPVIWWPINWFWFLVTNFQEERRQAAEERAAALDTAKTEAAPAKADEPAAAAVDPAPPAETVAETIVVEPAVSETVEAVAETTVVTVVAVAEPAIKEALAAEPAAPAGPAETAPAAEPEASEPAEKKA
jgi:hypothetical protein